MWMVSWLKGRYSRSLSKVKESESEVTQSCPTLCDPMDCSLPGSSVHGIFQARVLEWVTISFSRGSSQPRDWTLVSRVAGRCFTVWATVKEGPINSGVPAWSHRVNTWGLLPMPSRSSVNTMPDAPITWWGRVCPYWARGQELKLDFCSFVIVNDQQQISKEKVPHL